MNPEPDERSTRVVKIEFCADKGEPVVYMSNGVVLRGVIDLTVSGGVGRRTVVTLNCCVGDEMDAFG